MGSPFSRVVSTSVANRSYMRIWAKYDFHKNDVKLEEWSFYYFKMWMGVGVHKSTEYTSNTNFKEQEFQPIDPAQYKTFDIPSKFNNIVHLTVITDNGIIICNKIPKKIYRNVIITEQLQYRFGIKGKPFTIDEFSDNGNKVTRSNTQPGIYDVARKGLKRLDKMTHRLKQLFQIKR